jgi:hypothetical protein
VVYDYAEGFEWPSGSDFAGGINNVRYVGAYRSARTSRNFVRRRKF